MKSSHLGSGLLPSKWVEFTKYSVKKEKIIPPISNHKSGQKDYQRRITYDPYF